LQTADTRVTPSGRLDPGMSAGPASGAGLLLEDPVGTLRPADNHGVTCLHAGGAHWSGTQGGPQEPGGSGVVLRDP
jgi:hypothetical protein